jgi:N-acetylglucosamine-6-phosphate deacetylase
MSTAGYFDLQVNGYAGVDFNSNDLSASTLEAACSRLAADGVAGILATIITDEIEAMCGRLARIVSARRECSIVRDMIWGFHIEGPFLNPAPGYIGAHPAAAARSADVATAEALLAAADGLTRLVTLAPEQDESAKVTAFLSEQGVRVAAGHCNPTDAQLQRCIESGLSMFTHLGNGCPQSLPRHDNIIQRVLARSDELYIGFIADGVHAPYFALKNYLGLCGIERAFVVTDAISAAGQGPGEYTLANQTVVVDENLATWAADRSHLVGAAVTMRHSAENLRSHLGLIEGEVDQLRSINPWIAIGV